MGDTSTPGDQPTADMATIAAESVLIAGGGRAILLQIAHPHVGLGVAEHSDFTSDPFTRLRHTLSYVYAQVFGTEAERATVRAVVEAAHDRVAGTDDTVNSYSAHDPELQLWVAATLYDSAIRMHEHVYGPLGDERAEQVYLAYARLGTGLRMRPEQWPPSRAAFAAYWADALTELRVTPQSRAVAHSLLVGKALPLPLRAAMPLGRLVTLGTLPATLRGDYGFTWSAAQNRRFLRALALIRLVYPRLPRWLRQWPKNYFLRRIRRLAKTG